MVMIITNRTAVNEIMPEGLFPPADGGIRLRGEKGVSPQMSDGIVGDDCHRHARHALLRHGIGDVGVKFGK